MKPNRLKLVPNEPVDITMALRSEILSRDWDRVMIEGDRRGVVVLGDRRRSWLK